MKKILFIIPNLMHGGAERVLVNVVNALDRERFALTLLSVFDCGVNRADLLPHVRYRSVYTKAFRGNSHYFKLFSPAQLYKKFVDEHYDIVVSFLEGPAARIAAGCQDADTKKVCWIHTSLKDPAVFCCGFRSAQEAQRCYAAFDRVVCVSESVRADFAAATGLENNAVVLYNPIDGAKIRRLAAETGSYPLCDGYKSVCAVGKLIPVKGFDRLTEICARLRRDGIAAHFYICGSGGEQANLEAQIREKNIGEFFTLTGFLENPYSVLSRCDLFVCSSHREGYSSAACEALICGVPVVSTAVQGMDELLAHGEYGLICENNTDALYDALKRLLTRDDLLAAYRQKARAWGDAMDMSRSVAAIEDFLYSL